ncbi:hypothetical protein [Rhabdochromatium marinum]|uniref:hypothetical protein n=1 Tax=Rhabdochromatium marinum TaxID=48729 RepID=UPI001904482C|nr:hypothetical protein [Rhabdochromatium marinum]MBK1648338.1 hypothetical protein [Rhabdochromatium marinum]
MSAIGSRFDSTRRALAAGSALLLLGWLILQLSTGAGGNGGSSTASAQLSQDTGLQPALAQWQALWSQLANEGHGALAPRIEDPSLRAAGDTGFMRYRNLWEQVPAAAQRQFQLAALANSPERKVRLLQSLMESEEPLLRFRARLERARIALRQEDEVTAAAFARAALQVPDLPAPARADATFILGYAAAQAGALQEAEAQLGRAIGEDPGFWDARQLYLRVLGALLAQPNSTASRCLERTRELIEQLGALPALAQDRSQFRDIADHFARQAQADSPAVALMTGLGYLWAGDPEQARAQLTQAAHAHGQGPALCEARIAEQARVWLARLPPSPD